MVFRKEVDLDTATTAYLLDREPTASWEATWDWYTEI